MLLKNNHEFKWLGGTLDDAAGEVFDKVARVLNLPYPGGPEIEKAARDANPDAAKKGLPLPMAADRSFNFSFSGLKTAVVNLVQKEKPDVSQVAYEFQERICQSLIKKTFRAVEKYNVKTVVVGGGVAANRRLRELMEESGRKQNVEIFFPERKYSIDNGAMIAVAAFYQKSYVDPTKLQADPSLYFV
ncbi:hypothetical protein HY024_00765 [Candidatus Curtissbacteria bacterium]|nr:hypothetical protein [Candidatus Curtissbacteria bacterium]